jgi:sensor histidine kinase YesM
MKRPAWLNPSLLIAHLVLWGLFLLPPVPYYLQHRSIRFALLNLGVSGLYFGAFVYVNQYYFLPRFFFAGRRLTYVGVTLALLLPYAWAGGWLFDTITGERPPLLYLITRFYTIALAFGFIDQYVHRQQTQRRLLQLESQQTRLALERLQAHINPHFLFNTLHNLYALTLKQSPQAPQVVLGLSNLMRYLFTANESELVPLREEVAYLEQYVALERLRLSSERARITLLAEGPVDTIDLPPMLLIPFVENAFKHGVETDTGQVYVAITLAVQGRDVFFEIENSKPPRPALAPTITPPVATQTGLRNARQRLELLFGDRYQLTIDEQAAVYRVTLALHL